MPKPVTFSLASLFTLVTLIAVVIWGVTYLPLLMLLVVFAAIPAVVRMRMWFALASRLRVTFTVTQMTLDYLGAIVVGGLMSAAVGQVLLLTLNPYLPVQEHDPTVENIVWFAITLVAVGACEYFLLGELWLFPQRYVDAHERLPTQAELAGQLVKAASGATFVLGACTWSLLAMGLLFPPTQEFRRVTAAGLLAWQALTFFVAYRLVESRFADMFTRGLAAGLLASAIYFSFSEQHPSGLTWSSEFVPLPLLWGIFGLLIWAPGAPWPPRLESKVKPRRGGELPEVISLPDFEH